MATPVCIKVYWAVLGDMDSGDFERFNTVLDEQEKARALSLRKPEDRALFELSHGMLRFALSRCHDIPPLSWRFWREPGGRPRIVRGGNVPDLRFSLSHAGDVAACAVSEGDDVGIDVEDLDQAVDVLELSSMVLDSVEAADLFQSCRPEARQTQFFRYWTLKEALSKAIGKGMACPFPQCVFKLDPVRLLRAPNADPTRWNFEQQALTGRHLMSLAVQCDPVRRVHVDISLADRQLMRISGI